MSMTRVSDYHLRHFKFNITFKIFLMCFVFCIKVESQVLSSGKREIPADIMAQTQEIADLCKQDSLEEQIVQLKKSLNYLKSNIPPYYEEYSELIDTFALREMYSHLFGVDMAVYWEALDREDIQNTNVANGFLSQNRRMHNLLDEAAKPSRGFKYLLRDWEQKIYRGLSCLVNNYQ